MTVANPRSRTKRTVLATAILAILISGCGRNPKNDADAYLTGLKLFNYPACYEMLSRQDRLDCSLEQFLAEIPMAPDVSREWFKAILLKMNYELGEAKVEGDRAIVPVKVTMPDLALWERMLNAEQDVKEPIEARAQKSLRENRFPKVAYDDTIVMAKESDGWKIVVDFARKERVAKFHRQAIDLYHKHDYDKAIASYNDLLAELGKAQATGSQGLRFRYERELRVVETAKAQMAEALAYIAKVLLTNVDMKMTASQVPGIFGQITNGGDKPLDEVRVKVTFYSGKGKKRKAVFSEEHTPIATPLEFTNFSRDVTPFRPNQTRDFGFRLTAPAEIQRTAKADVTVTMVAFSQLTIPDASKTGAAGTAPSPSAEPPPAPAAPEAPPPMPKG
jgi:hypothetical protein